MRRVLFITVIAVILLIYYFINYYIFSRGLMTLPKEGTYRKWFTGIFIFLSVSFFAGRLLQRIWLSHITDVLVWSGSFWLAFMVYALIFVIFIDFIRLIHLAVPVYTGFVMSNPAFTRLVLFWVALGAIGMILVAGYVNAISPKITRLNFKVNKQAGNLHHLNIVMASDIHMGTLVGPRRTAHLVRMINDLNPDIVMLAGDMVDEDLAPVIRYDLGRALKEIHSKMGVYAITGNHEYIGGADKACHYLAEHGITMLRDSAVLVDNSFWLVGRDDRDAGRFSKKPRHELKEVLAPVDFEKPVILMDHQPFNLEDVAKYGVDLQLSGHTHHGQLWPFNYITKAIYEISMGYKKIGNTNFYVSCGYGGWGPPIRTNSRPEVVSIQLVFN